MLTSAFSGKPARGVRNRFADELAAVKLPPYPVMHALTRPLRTAAAAAGRAEFLSLWAGQGVPAVRDLPAADLIATLEQQTTEAFARQRGPLMGATRRMWTLYEPIHSVIYFTTEGRAAAAEAGYRGFWMSYFAMRAAPLGAVGSAVVAAAFYGFHSSRVRRALPDAWAFAPPQRALNARLSGADAALRRVWDDAAVSPEVAALWQAATTLREHRGDGHNAVLVAAGVGPVQAHLLKIAAGETDAATLRQSRAWPDPDWRRAEDDLLARGWITPEARLTDAGTAARAAIEAATDQAANQPWRYLGAHYTARLVALLGPLARSVIEAGAFPLSNPVGAPPPR